MKKTLYLFVIILINVSFSVPLNAQWVKILDEPIFERILLDIYFLPDNPDYGWICGMDSRLLRTTDRGENWDEYKIDPNKKLGAGFFESVIFLNPQVGYVSGPSGIYKSTNGGKSWKQVFENYNGLWGCYFVDENYGIAVGDGCNGKQYFYRTTDGGKSWNTKIYSGEQTGMTDVYLESKDGFGLAVSSGYIWITTDGGRNWEKRNSTGGIDWQEELSFKGNTFVLPYAEGCSGSYNSGGGVRFSLDGGFTFRETDLGAEMFGSFVISDSVAWVCGRGNTMKKTTDAGLTWTQYDCGLKVEDDMDDIYFIDDTTGFVVGKGIYKYTLPSTYKAEIIMVDSSGCDDDPVLLEAKGDFAYYKWNGKEGDKFLEVEESGTYILEVYQMECDTTIADTIDVDINQSVVIDIAAETEALCVGDTAFISFDSKLIQSIKWSDGLDADSRIFTKDTIVYLELVDVYGCTYEQEFDIKFEPYPEVIFGEYSKASCVNEPVYLSADVIRATNHVWYKDGKPISDQESIEVENGSDYYIVAENKYGCEAISDTVEVEYEILTDQISATPIEGEEDISLGEMTVVSPLRFTIGIRNNSNIDYVLEEAFMELNSCFSVPKAQFPALIPADSVLELDVNFFCADYGELKDKLVIRDRCSYDTIGVEIIRLHNKFDVVSQCEVPLTVTNVKMKYPRLTHAKVKNQAGKIVAHVQYESDKQENAEISIYNTLGNKIAALSSNQNIVESDGALTIYSINAELSEEILKSGIYFISVDVGGAVTNLKVAVSK